MTRTHAELPAGEQTTLGLCVTAKEAVEKWRADSGRVKIIDVRAPEEALFIGQPVMARKTGVGAQRCGRAAVKAQFPLQLPSDVITRVSEAAPPGDTWFVMCRSGGRSAIVVNLLAKPDFTQGHNAIDGLEGDLVKDPGRVFVGQRLKSGWKNSACPWACEPTPELMRLPVSRPAAAQGGAAQ